MNVSINGLNHESDFHFDSCGGYWLLLHKSLLSLGDNIKIRFARISEELSLFQEVTGIKQDWVSPSYYTDSDHESIISKAIELTEGLSTRLFVALCRAANVHARTVWGIVNAHDNRGGYNNHHRWAQSLDDSGYWHAMDFGYTIDFDLNDIRYLDLI